MTDPFNIAILVGSPSESSRTLAVAQHVEQRLMRGAFRVRIINVRELPPAALLRADTSDPEIAKAVEAIEHAEGVVIASPVYKAAPRLESITQGFIDGLRAAQQL